MYDLIFLQHSIQFGHGLVNIKVIKSAWMDIHCLGQGEDRTGGDIYCPMFYSGDLGQGNFGTIGKLLLGHTGFLSKSPYVCA